MISFMAPSMVVADQNQYQPGKGPQRHGWMWPTYPPAAWAKLPNGDLLSVIDRVRAVEAILERIQCQHTRRCVDPQRGICESYETCLDHRRDPGCSGC